MSQVDKRQDPRFERSFWIWFRPVVTGVESWQVAPLRDLSTSGARFLSECAFDEGVVLETKLLLPVSSDPLRLAARVAWSRPVEGKAWKLIEHGVTFDFTDRGLQQQVAAAVEYFTAQKKRDPAQEERRQRPRIRGSFHAKYRRLDDAAPLWHQANPLNLSADGVRFLSPQTLERGCRLDVSILPPKGLQPLSIQGRVIWGKAYSSGVVEHGVEFIELTTDQRRQIEQLLERVSEGR